LTRNQISLAKWHQGHAPAHQQVLMELRQSTAAEEVQMLEEREQELEQEQESEHLEQNHVRWLIEPSHQPQ
jgi:hypothetical protein